MEFLLSHELVRVYGVANADEVRSAIVSHSGEPSAFIYRFLLNTTNFNRQGRKAFLSMRIALSSCAAKDLNKRTY